MVVSPVTVAPALLIAAQAYIAAGWRVLPLHTPVRRACTCGSPTCASPGKHPRVARGVHAASSDPVLVKSWWTRWPSANVGVATGAGLVVIDVDGELGRASLQAAAARLGKLPATVTAITGRGRHLYFATSAELANSSGRLGPGVDTRGRGGHVAAPPSIHVSGCHYEWRYGPEAYELAELPAAWVDALLPKGRSPREPKASGPAPRGRRAGAILSLLSQGMRWLADHGHDPDRYGSRSESELALVCGLVRVGATTEDIVGVFEGPIGERLRERAPDSPVAYIERLIERAGQYVGEHQRGALSTVRIMRWWVDPLFHLRGGLRLAMRMRVVGGAYLGLEFRVELIIDPSPDTRFARFCVALGRDPASGADVLRRPPHGGHRLVVALAFGGAGRDPVACFLPMSAMPTMEATTP